MSLNAELSAFYNEINVQINIQHAEYTAINLYFYLILMSVSVLFL